MYEAPRGSFPHRCVTLWFTALSAAILLSACGQPEELASEYSSLSTQYGISVELDPSEPWSAFSLKVRNNSGTAALTRLELDLGPKASFDRLDNTDRFTVTPDLGKNNDGVRAKKIRLDFLAEGLAPGATARSKRRGDIDPDPDRLSVVAHFDDGRILRGQAQNRPRAGQRDAMFFVFERTANEAPNRPAATVTLDPTSLTHNFVLTVQNRSQNTSIVQVIVDAKTATFDRFRSTAAFVANPQRALRENNDGRRSRRTTLDFRNGGLPPLSSVKSRGWSDLDGRLPEAMYVEVYFANGESVTGSASNVQDADDGHPSKFVFSGREENGGEETPTPESPPQNPGDDETPDSERPPPSSEGSETPDSEDAPKGPGDDQTPTPKDPPENPGGEETPDPEDTPASPGGDETPNPENPPQDPGDEETPDPAPKQVSLYDVFEQTVTNRKSYSNPFDYKRIELQTRIVAPSGLNYEYFGFFDGDGKGGQNGPIWRFRFMPNETGLWSYTYRWTDGTPGGKGTFLVSDKAKLPGPLKVARDNPWFFEDARGNPFHAQPYDLHHVGPVLFSVSWNNAAAKYSEVIDKQMLPYGYNMSMVDSPSSTGTTPNWWQDNVKTKFDISVWRNYERILAHALKKRIYLFPFDGAVSQSNVSQLSDQLLRYYVARFGAFASYMAFNLTREWEDVWRKTRLTEQMRKVLLWNPSPALLSAHDASYNEFLFDPSRPKTAQKGWMSFSLRQVPSRNIVAGHGRALNRSGSATNFVDTQFVDKPIIGSEDHWEMPSGKYGQPRNATEVRRGVWGAMMAGVIPMYSEWHQWVSQDPKLVRNRIGRMPGEPEVRRMFKFFYALDRYKNANSGGPMKKLQYRAMRPQNVLVSSPTRQISIGIPKKAYVVYSEQKGSITLDLSSVSSDTRFEQFWFDPTYNASQDSGPIFSRIVRGGDVQRFDSPFPADAVLLLRRLGDS